jgi:hypothetical protein
MEENAKTERQLSKEQLQEITGGCGQCLQDITQASHHLAMTKGYMNISNAALNRLKPKTEFARTAQKLAKGHKQAAENLMNTVSAKLNTPEH